MCGTWSGLGLLLVVPWLTSCVSGPPIHLDTGQGTPLVYTPPAHQPPPVLIPQEEFLSALTSLVLHLPLSVHAPGGEGRFRLASWEGDSRAPAWRLMEHPCAPSEPPDGCLSLPEHAPPPETLARMRLALSFSMDTLWEGATVPLGEYLDPLAFKLTVYTAMSTYLLLLLFPVPEPITKGLAAVLTLYLVVYLGLGPVRAMALAARQLLEDSERATTAEELKEAGQRFGRVLGDNGMRVLLLLVTAALGGKQSFLGKAPGLPGFPRAALTSPARTGVRLEAAGQVSSVALGVKELTVRLAPTAVASISMGPGGETAPRKGSLTGRPNRPSANEKNAENLRAAERENESARILAENGYYVEQSPASKINRKKPDYKINGEYADCYAPSTDNPRSIRNAIAGKVNTGQADRIILNLDDSRVTLDALRKQLLEDPIPDLKELIIIKDRKPIPFYP